MSEAQSSQPVTPRPPMSGSSARPALPWWVLTIVIVCALLMATGAIMALVNPAMLADSDEKINGAVRVYAGYLVSRNLAIAAMLLGTLIAGARRPLGAMMVLAALVQFMDAVIDCFEARWTLVPGVLVLVLLLLIAASRVSQRRLLKVGFWRDPPRAG